MLQDNDKVSELRKFLDQIYNHDKDTFGDRVQLKDLDDNELLSLSRNLVSGVPMATPVFDGAFESELKHMLRLADLPESGQNTLFDGRPDESIARPVTEGYKHLLKH